METKNLIDAYLRLLNVLECPVCLDYLTKPVALCNTGHAVCSKCKSYIRNCPICRNRMSSTRGIITDQIIESLLYPCYKLGCGSLLKRKDAESHDLNCTLEEATDRHSVLHNNLLKNIEENFASFVIKPEIVKKTRTVGTVTEKEINETPKSKRSGAQRRKLKRMMNAMVQYEDTVRSTETIASAARDQISMEPKPSTHKRSITSTGTSEPMAKIARSRYANLISKVLATGGCEVAVIPNGYPSTLLSWKQGEEVKSQLIHILDQQEEGGRHLEFSDFSYHHGGCIIVCDNPAAKDWLSRIMGSFTVSGAITLRTGIVDELQKVLEVGAYFPGEKILEDQLLKRLRIQNANVPDIDKWIILDTKMEKSGFYGILRMPETSMRYFEERKWLVTYGCSKVSFRLLDKKQPKNLIKKMGMGAMTRSGPEKLELTISEASTSETTTVQAVEGGSTMKTVELTGPKPPVKVKPGVGDASRLSPENGTPVDSYQ
ncbi:uncharacterized protein [Halyomorpha halys]|nr:uncharacterized protein LOC106684788 [Halyomorpha halys]